MHHSCITSQGLKALQKTFSEQARIFVKLASTVALSSMCYSVISSTVDALPPNIVCFRAHNTFPCVAYPLTCFTAYQRNTIVSIDTPFRGSLKVSRHCIKT